MSYAYIPRTSECQEEILFFADERFVRNFSQSSIVSLGTSKSTTKEQRKRREIKRSRPIKSRAVTRRSSEVDGIEKGLNGSLRFWFGGRSDAISRRSATFAGAYFSFNPLSS